MAFPVINERKGILRASGRPCAGNGFTVLEMMIALFILTVSILAMTSLAVTSIQTNHQNDLRNTAIKVTSEIAEILLAQHALLAPGTTVTEGLAPYDGTNTALQPDFRWYPNPVQRVKGGSQQFTATWVATGLTDQLTQFNITVSYTYKGQNRSNSATIYKHQAS